MLIKDVINIPEEIGPLINDMSNELDDAIKITDDNPDLTSIWVVRSSFASLTHFLGTDKACHCFQLPRDLGYQFIPHKLFKCP